MEAQFPPPQRLLVRGVNWLGDAVMTTPALVRLRERFPSAHITLAVREKIAPIFTPHPAIDHLLPFPAGAGPWTVSHLLGTMNFDTALVMPNSHRAALEVRLARISCRVGLDRPWRNWLLTRVVPRRVESVRMRKLTKREIRARLSGGAGPQSAGWQAGCAHQICDHLHLVGGMGADTTVQAPSLFVAESEIQHIAAKFNLPRGTVESEPTMIGLNPGAAYGSAKRWPAEYFAQTAVELRRKLDCFCLILGGPKEELVAEQILDGIRRAENALRVKRSPRPVLNLSGRTSLRELMAVLALCRVVLTNDSGPMHIAAAVGARVVAIFGSTAPELTGPGSPGSTRHTIMVGGAPCAPCFRRTCPIDLQCMHGIAPKEAAEAVFAAANISTTI